jgi:hypothetical protein
MNNFTQKFPRHNLYNALIEKSQMCMKHQDGTVGLATTDERDIVNYLYNIEVITKKIAKSKKTIFRYKVRTNSPECYLVEDPLAKAILPMLLTIYVIKAHYLFNVLNPYVNVFIQAVNNRNIQFIQPNWIGVGEMAKTNVAHLNGFVTEIRDVINGSAFKKEIASHVRSVNKNYRELCKYINCLFYKHSRLLVVRVDLTYLNRFCKPQHEWVLDQQIVGWEDDANADPNFIRDHKKLYATYPEIKQHRERLLKDMNSKMFKDSLVGHAWKLEFGLNKGFHYHFLFVFDGSKLREDVTIGAIIGEHWVNNITDGRGLYWNCNANKYSYRQCGIGTVNAGDIEARKALESVAHYLCKVDYYIKTVAPDNGRTFGKGNMPEPETRPRRGRPRKDQDDA